MLNLAPLNKFQILSNNLFKPIYDDYSFLNIAPSIQCILTGMTNGHLLPADCFNGAYPRSDKIVLFFIDSFGWQFWQENYAKFPAMKKVVDSGCLTPISAVFPTTTAAAVSSIILNVPPSKHALFEWREYIPEYDEVIITLPFSPYGDQVKPEDCLGLGFNPEHLLAYKKPFPLELSSQGVKCFQFVTKANFYSSYNKLISSGSSVIPVKSLEESLGKLKKLMNSASGKLFAYLYWGDIDAAAHQFGPNSLPHLKEISRFWTTFERFFQEGVGDTIFLFTADHGQINATSSKPYYLNLEIPELRALMKKNKKGKLIYPCGSPRDVFLHIKEDKIKYALNLLKEKLTGLAFVLTGKEALDLGLFGYTPPSPQFLNRLGDILILPYREYIWWYEKGVSEKIHIGQHGGLTKEELITVLGYLRF